MRATSVKEPASYWPVRGVMRTVWRRLGATLILIVTGMYRLVCPFPQLFLSSTLQPRLCSLHRGLWKEMSCN